MKIIRDPSVVDNFSIKMSKSFQGFVKMPPRVGMPGSCPCPAREESDPELCNTFGDVYFALFLKNPPCSVSESISKKIPTHSPCVTIMPHAVSPFRFIAQK